MEALEKAKEKRMKAGSLHGIKSGFAMVDPAATHQHVRLRIKLPVSPARNLIGSTKGARPTSSKPVGSNQEPGTSDLSDHKSSGTEATSPASEYQNLSNTSLKELRRRYEAKFGTVTLSNNSDYLKRKLAGQCGPPRLRRTSVEHDVAVGRSPTFRRRRTEEVLEADGRELEAGDELEDELEADAEGEGDDDTDPECGMLDAGALTPLKKQRSGRRDGGAVQWTNQADEIRRIVRKKRRNRAFPAQTLVWARLEERPWWPARVVSLEELPEFLLEKRLVGWTCVELYGLPSSDEQRFAWLKRENLASYKKFRKDLNDQKFPERLEDGNFQLALKEISEEARRRRSADNAGVGARLLREERESSMELRSSNTSSSDDDGSEAPTRVVIESYDTEKKHLKHRAEIVQGKLKQMRRQNVLGLQARDWKAGRPVWPIKGVEDQMPASSKKAREDGGNMSRKRKRLVVDEHEKDDSHGTSEEAEDVRMPESPARKAVSESKFNRQSSERKMNRSLSNAGESVKLEKDGSRKPKRTGEDGYYYDCEVCGIGGELLCCDLCPRVYHLECLTPPLKRTPPGKWVCPTCRDRSGSVRSGGSLFADARQQAKSIKGGEDPSARVAHKIWRKEKPAGPVISSDDSVKRKREELDPKRRRKRAKSRGEDSSKEGGGRRLNCGYCGVETGCLRSSGLCEKCHSEIRAGIVGDNPDGYALAEGMETTESDKDREKSGRCDTCGERGVVVRCESCSRGFHKECVVPSLQRTPESPWCCGDCSSAGDDKLGEPSDAVSAEVQCILGCRVAGGQDAASSRRVSEMGRGGQVKVKGQENEEGDMNGTVGMTSEGGGDGAAIEWKVVKRVQSVGMGSCDVDPGEGRAEAGEAMEIDPSSGGDAGAAVMRSRRKSAGLEKEQAGNGAGVAGTERRGEDRSVRGTSKDETNSGRLVASNGAIEGVEDSSFVIEIGGHDMSLNVGRGSLEGVAKSDGSVGKKEMACGGSVDSAAQGGEEVATKMDRIQNESGGVTDGVVLGTRQEEGDKGVVGARNSADMVAQKEQVPRLEFLVRWVGRSHIHNEWVSEEKLRSIAKEELESYVAEYGTAALSIMDERWLEPQRILARRSGKSGGAEVLVKWQRLAYDECSWEEERHPVIAGNRVVVEDFERFEAAAVAKQGSVTRGDRRPSAIEELSEQPEWLKGGGVLFGHQVEALNWLRKSWHERRHVVFADEMGLGKTTCACAFLCSMYREFHASAPCLVVAPLSRMSKWQAELSVWAPVLNVIEYHGSAKARSVIREHEWYGTVGSRSGEEGKHGGSQVLKFDVMVTSYEMVMADSSRLRCVPWEVLMVDEGHGHNSSKRELFAVLRTFNTGQRVLVRGTAVESNLSEMYRVLDFVQPETSSSRGAFEEKLRSLGTAEQVDEVKKLVVPHMLRRLKGDVMPSIPAIVERVVPVELAPVQAEQYRDVLTRNYQLLRQAGGGKSGGRKQSLLNVMMQLRKVCNHPYLVAGLEPEGGSPKLLQEMRIKASAKLAVVHSMLHHLKKGGHRVVILSQMTKVLDILEAYLSYEFGDESFERVDGSVAAGERQKAMSRFNEDESRFVFLLSTRSCGLGIDLGSADTVIVYDSDLNPRADIEAMNRAHRIGESQSLAVYRLVIRASVEEAIVELARKTSMLEQMFANRSGSHKEVEGIIVWGTEKLFAEDRSVQGGDSSAVGYGEGSVKDKVDEGTASAERIGKIEKGDEVVWDDAAVSRLLDRSEVAVSNPEGGEGEQERERSGSLKTRNSNEREGAEQVDSEDGGPRDIDERNVTEEHQSHWDMVLRARWERLQKEEEAARGREKRTREHVMHNDSVALKSVDDSTDYSEEEGLHGDHTSEPRVKALPGKVRAKQLASSTGDTMQSSVAHEDKPASAFLKAPATSSSFPLAASSFPEVATRQQLSHDGDAGDRRPHSRGVHADGPAISSGIQVGSTTGLGDSGRTTSSTNHIINVEQSRNGNVSYPHRVYTVPGTPVSSLTGGEQLVPRSKSLVASSISSDPMDVDLSALRKQFAAERSSKGGLASQGIRQLLPPSIPGSSAQFGSVGQSSRRPPVLFESLGRSFGQSVQGQTGGSEAASRLFPADVGVSGARGHRAGSEERIFDSSGMRRHDGELQGVLSGPTHLPQPELLQRAFPRDGQNSAMLSTSGLSGTHASATKNEAMGSMSIGEILKRIANQNGGSMLPPASSDGRNLSQSLSGDAVPNVLGPNQSGQGFPNLSMSLGTGGLNLPSHDQALLLRARASHDSQHLSRSHNKMGGSLGGLSSSGGSGDGTGVQVGEACLTSIVSDRLEGRSLDGASRLLSGSQDMGGLQSGHKHGTSKKGSPFGGADARSKQGLELEHWTEDELDALWTGVRRLGCGNWAAMLEDPRLRFQKSRSAQDLAERWRDEQLKLFGAPAMEVESKPVRRGYSGEDGTGQRYRDHNSGSEEVNAKKVSSSQRRESGDSLFPKDTVDLSRDSAMNHGLGSGFGEFDRKQVLESLRAVDLSYRRSSSMTSNPGLERLEVPKVHEPSSALELVNSVRSQVSSGREVGIASRSGLSTEAHNMEFDKWEGSSSRRRNDVSKEAVLRQSQLQKAKVPASFLANLALNQSSDSREKQSQELRDHHTLPLLPQVSLPGLGLLGGGQSSSGAFSHKASFGHQMQTEHFLQRGYHDSARGHHDSRSSLSSTFADLDRRRLKLGLGSSKNSDVTDGNEASQSLPHWLREAFKPDQPPPPKPATVSPMITAVAQATSFLYKEDCVPFLPPFVHPGALPAPPRRAVRKRGRAGAGEGRGHGGDGESGRGTEVVGGRNELNFLMAGVEASNPSLSSSLQHFASSLNAGFKSSGGQLQSAPSTSSFPNRPVDFSSLPSLEPLAQPSFSRPSPALEELMALKNLSSLPQFAPPLNEPVSGGLDRSLVAQSSSRFPDLAADGTSVAPSSGKGDRHGAKGGRHRSISPFPVNKQSQSGRKGGVRPKETTHSRHRKEAPARKRRSRDLPFASSKSSDEERSPDSAHKHRQDGSGWEPQLPSWLVPTVDSATVKSRQKASSKHDGGDSSSETESDPRIHGAAGMAGDDGDASSDETVSDDRTQ